MIFYNVNQCYSSSSSNLLHCSCCYYMLLVHRVNTEKGVWTTHAAVWDAFFKASCYRGTRTAGVEYSMGNAEKMSNVAAMHQPASEVPNQPASEASRATDRGP